MAEFKEKKLEPPSQAEADGFANMGKPIPAYRRQAAYDHCKAMGLEDTHKRWACVNGVAEQLERDKPYEAMAAGMKYLDLTGTYRIMAVLLIADKPRVRVPAAK